MYEIINIVDQILDVHKDDEGNIVIDDMQFEVADTDKNKEYRIVAYSLQDGTDNIRVSFDLWNNEDECYEEIGYGFYDSDGGQITESAGEDLEDLKLQEAVIGRIFAVTLPYLSTVRDLDQFLKEHKIEVL